MYAFQPISNILLVTSAEDKNITLALEQAGFKLDVFTDIEKAEECLLTIKPDLILVYSDLANDHGLHFCQIVKNAQINPRPIIVFLVHESNIDERVEVLRAGADDVISYPISGKEIAFRIRDDFGE